MNQARIEGRIKFFNDEKGFGFIKNPVEGGPDIFIHISQLQKTGITVAKGDVVGFRTAQTKKGVVAEEIELIKRAEPKATERRDRYAEAQY